MRKQGRPLTGAEPLNVRLVLQITQSQADALDEAAKALGVHRSAIAREAIDELVSSTLVS